MDPELWIIVLNNFCIIKRQKYRLVCKMFDNIINALPKEFNEYYLEYKRTMLNHHIIRILEWSIIHKRHDYCIALIDILDSHGHSYNRITYLLIHYGMRDIMFKILKQSPHNIDILPCVCAALEYDDLEIIKLICKYACYYPLDRYTCFYISEYATVMSASPETIKYLQEEMKKGCPL